GRTRDVGQVVPYKQELGGFPSVLWERVVQHTIRPAMDDGLLLPYQHVLGVADETGIDPADYAVFVPDEATAEFSYASEHVRHDTAISLLLALDRTVAKLAPLAPGSWDQVREWLSARLAEVWQARGPYPGRGAQRVRHRRRDPAGARDPVAPRGQRRPVAPGRPLAAESIVGPGSLRQGVPGDVEGMGQSRRAAPGPADTAITVRPDHRPGHA